jgi:hypothetical protein
VDRKRITLAFSPHRIETLPLAVRRMRRHEAIILEEPEHPGLAPMLQKKLSIDEYLLETDVGFPRFARRSCQLLRELYAEGKEILQIDPFMDRLLEILNKEEMADEDGLFPHTWDQIESNRLVEGLSYSQCRGLFKAIRSLATGEARQRVRTYRQRVK